MPPKKPNKYNTRSTPWYKKDVYGVPRTLEEYNAAILFRDTKAYQLIGDHHILSETDKKELQQQWLI